MKHSGLTIHTDISISAWIILSRFNKISKNKNNPEPYSSAAPASVLSGVSSFSTTFRSPKERQNRTDILGHRTGQSDKVTMKHLYLDRSLLTLVSVKEHVDDSQKRTWSSSERLSWESLLSAAANTGLTSKPVPTRTPTSAGTQDTHYDTFVSALCNTDVSTIKPKH